jgi:hypothetical protein
MLIKLIKIKTRLLLLILYLDGVLMRVLMFEWIRVFSMGRAQAVFG